MAIHFHEEDLPADVSFADGPIAVDTEAMGLVPGRDRLCLVQLSDGAGDEHLVRFGARQRLFRAQLKALLADPSRLKMYHFARFDIGIMQAYLGIMAAPLYCTRTASRLVRTYTDRHGLKDLVKELLNIDVSKQQQTSDWGADELQRCPARICGERRPLPACAQGQARRAASSARTGWRWPGVLRFPARPRHARYRRLARTGHFRPRWLMTDASA